MSQNKETLAIRSLINLMHHVESLKTQFDKIEKVKEFRKNAGHISGDGKLDLGKIMESIAMAGSGASVPASNHAHTLELPSGQKVRIHKIGEGSSISEALFRALEGAGHMAEKPAETPEAQERFDAMAEIFGKCPIKGTPDQCAGCGEEPIGFANPGVQEETDGLDFGGDPLLHGREFKGDTKSKILTVMISIAGLVSNVEDITDPEEMEDVLSKVHELALQGSLVAANM